MQIHDSEHKSYLSSSGVEKISYLGLVNLLVLILLSYTVRAIIESLEQNDFVIAKEVK